MVFKFFDFTSDDPYILDARPGSPHPFFSLISSASSSPEVWSNCIGGFAAGVASAHRRCLSPVVLQTLGRVRVEDEAVDEVGEPLPDSRYAGHPAIQTQRRVSDVGSIFGKVGEMAADILDTVGSFTFTSGSTKKASEINILAFEVANTIVRGANLMESLSEENIRHLKEVVLPSEGVQCLVSEDMDELLKISALDKKEELKVFLGEVIRFGNLCKDPQWHNLDRYFEKLLSQLQKKQSEVSANLVVQQLIYLIQSTAELYYELHTIDRLEQDYVRKLHDYDRSNARDGGDRDSLLILRADLKAQKKRIKGLKKKSLWSRTLEEVVEKLVDIAIFLYFEIDEVFDIAECDLANGSLTNRRTLGSACLDLQYATVITHINALVSQPSSVPPNTRDALYQGLPGHVQSALRQQLRKFRVPEDHIISEIEEVMEEWLQWLMPMAAKTIKAHHSFSWLGEWANFMTNSNRKPADVMRIGTLYHADIERTSLHILELLLWLHYLVGRSRAQDVRDGSPAKDVVSSSPSMPRSKSEIVMFNKLRMQRLGSSKSQKLGDGNAQARQRRHRLATSSSDSPTTETKRTFPDEGLLFPVINTDDIDWIKVLDIIDGVDMV